MPATLCALAVWPWVRQFAQIQTRPATLPKHQDLPTDMKYRQTRGAEGWFGISSHA